MSITHPQIVHSLADRLVAVCEDRGTVHLEDLIDDEVTAAQVNEHLPAARQLAVAILKAKGKSPAPRLVRPVNVAEAAMMTGSPVRQVSL